MKPYISIITLGSALLAACSQHPVYTPATTTTSITPGGVNQPKRQYLALPGQSAVRVATEETDAAFDNALATYGGGAITTEPAPAQQAPQAYMDALNGTPAPTAYNVTPGAAIDAAPLPATVPGVPTTPIAPNATDADFPTPQNVATTAQQDVTAPVETTPAAPAAVAPAGTADYAVQITNGTTGRIFVEAQDAAGHIFPCGPMFGGQSINTPPDPVGPLKGPITVVVRDPDKDGAPEIRRYKVDPPAVYQGKTVGITILPGGQYRADVDNEVYYTSPAPTPNPAPAGGAPGAGAQ